MVKSRSGNVHKRLYKNGEFVDALIEGKWHLGIVQGLACTKEIKGIAYIVLLTNENVSKNFSDKMLRPSETFSQELALELENEMPDPVQEIPDKIEEKKEDILIQVSQEPWRDSHDFVNPQPMKAPKTKRFLPVTESDIDKLQDQCKSKNTHKQTGWGIRTLRGEPNL